MNPNAPGGALPSFGSVTSTVAPFSFGTNTATTGTSFGLGTGASPSVGFGVTSTAAAPPPSFGLSTATSASPFGSTGTGFANLGVKPSATTTAPTGFSFGQQAPTTATAPAPVTFAGLQTGFSTIPPTSNPAVSSAANALSLLSSVASSVPAATSAPQTGFSLGSVAPTAATATTAAAATGFSLATTAPASTGFSLNLGTIAPASTSAPSLGGLGGTVTSTAPAAITTSTPAAPPKSLVSFSELDDTIHKWTLELVELERVFLNQMDQVRDWDRLLLSTGDKIVTLNGSMQRVKLRQQQLNHELDFIVAQQRELEECLVPLEKEFADVTVSDPERNSVYQSAENLNTQLQQISEDLKGVIEHINEKNKSQDTNDPIVQIGRILNAHMNSLQWVDQNTAVIQQMLDQVGKMRDIYRRDTDSAQNI